MARPKTADRLAVGPASMAMAALGLWILDVATKPRNVSRTPLREVRDTDQESPHGLCLVAGITWFASMAVPAITATFIFASLEGAGVDLRWWGWLPVTFLCAAVFGFAVNWLRDLLNGDAIPTLDADLLIGVLVLASTIAIFSLQQTAFR